MLDVHPPEHTPHSWRDFLIHIATIVIGLLIAVGLEQSVEAFHRHRERAELREQLQHESEQILRDSSRVEAAMSAEVVWEKQIDALLVAAKDLHPVGSLPPKPRMDLDIPDDPVYKAAKASNKLMLLSQEETEAFGEMDGLIEHIFAAYDHREAALIAMFNAQRRLGLTQPIDPAAPQSSFGGRGAATTFSPASS